MKRYALVIGIGKYTNLNELSKPASDAQAVAEVLRKHGGFQDVKLLNGTKAKPGWSDYDTLDEALTKFLKQAANQDALIYFSGHGFTLEESRFVKRGYLATSSCKVKFKDKRIISQEESFSFDDLNGLVQEANLSSLLMLLDCCHSGFLIEDDLVKKSLLAFSRNNYCLIAACRGFQEAYALKSKSHSVFTGTLLESLLQENARQGVVTALDAFGRIDRELRGSGQEPIFLGMGGAIPVVSYEVVAAVEPDETCPYQGLEAFTEATAQFFFGRQTDVEALWQKLEQRAFVPVIGASGSGKSSLVRAGLIPALKQSGTNWTVLEPIKPGEEPLTQLRKPLEELARQLPSKVQLGHLLRKAPEGLQPLIEQLPDTARFLLVVDQFEEVFTVCLDEEEQARFIQLVTQVAAMPTSRLAVVITVRADFVEACLHYEALKQLIQTQAVYLSPLTGADLTDAITQPAAKQGYHLMPDLLAAIVNDTREEPGFLPLLQFALTKLWEYRDSQAHALTSAAYITIGKLAGALDSHANQIYTHSNYIDPLTGEINLSANQCRSQIEQDWIRAMLLRLVRTNEAKKDTRQPQRRSTLMNLADATPEAQPQIGLVLESLIKGRLLVSERETIDLSHEALTTGWQRLADWCQESRSLRRLSERLEAARLEWEKDQHNPNLNLVEKNRNLMMGGLLAEVREQWEALISYLQDFSKDETFLHCSDAYEQDQITLLQEALAGEKAAWVEVETANRFRDQFLAMLSHELRTPMNPIIGWSKLLKKGKLDQAKTAHALETIERNALLQSQLIENLLDIASSGQGKMHLDVESVNLAAIIEAALETVQVAAEAKQILIQTTLNPIAQTTLGDSRRLQQVVWNLLSNAVKFTPSGGQVHLKLEKVGTYALIQVKDTGQGINPEFLPYMFDGFRQQDSSTNRQSGGMGLGLSIVRYIVQLHGGTVEAESSGEGKGAVFSVRLPLIQDE